jgi:hypothetical protein
MFFPQGKTTRREGTRRGFAQKCPSKDSSAFAFGKYTGEAFKDEPRIQLCSRARRDAA